MDADKLKDLTSVKANKNKQSARPKQAATGDYSQLYPGQPQAIDKLSDWYFSNELECTLEGYAGTGKTFILRQFIEYLDSINYNFTLCAPTHRAKFVLEELTGYQTDTLHHLLSMSPNVDIYHLNLKDLKFKSSGKFKISFPLLVITSKESHIYKPVPAAGACPEPH